MWRSRSVTPAARMISRIASARRGETPSCLGYGDVGCYGATRIKTPNVDRIAREGCRFTDGHSSSATCTPSRYAMMTGEYPWRRKGTGILPGDAALIIEPGRPTLPAILKQA